MGSSHFGTFIISPKVFAHQQILLTSCRESVRKGLTPMPANLYVQGTIAGLTGGNVGASRAIANMGDGWVYLKLGFLSPVIAGDQFQLLPGCDRTLATCTTVFNNASHFGGFPYVPTPETAV